LRASQHLNDIFLRPAVVVVVVDYPLERATSTAVRKGRGEGLGSGGQFCNTPERQDDDEKYANKKTDARRRI
jgi:hypothetical protein